MWRSDGMLNGLISSLPPRPGISLPLGRLFERRRRASLGGRCLVSLLFAVLIPSLSLAAATVNVPVGSRAYDDLERLEVKGLVSSGLLSTRPFGRSEAARLVKEAGAALDVRGEGADILMRLEKEFARELDGDGARTFFRPARSFYIRGLYSDRVPYFNSVNNNGDAFSDGGSLRAGMAAEAAFLNAFALYLNPEYRLDGGTSRGELAEGYLKAALGPIEFQAGRDSMWWGPGYHGGLLLADNARALDMVRLSTARPVILPWVFGRLGLLRPTVFLARLEKDRDFANANLLGMRLDFKPLPSLSVALSRVFMFGGEGRRSLSSSDWFEVFTASDSAEHAKSPINGNQLASIDASYVFVNQWRFIPFSGVKLYTEWAAEDSSGETKTPTGRANIYGAYIDEPLWLKDTDLRVEWANTGRSERYGPRWYKHGVYTSGYTHRGRVIGHHMGGDSKDFFARAQHHWKGGTRLALEADIERSGVHGALKTKRKWYAAEISLAAPYGMTMTGGAGVEDIDGPSGLESYTGSTAWLSVDKAF